MTDPPAHPRRSPATDRAVLDAGTDRRARCGADRGALRISEALVLCARDLNRERGTLRVHSGKGHKPRTVGLDATAFALIDRWRAKKAERGLDPQTTPLFCTLQGGVIAITNIGPMLKRRAAKAGIDKRVHPHGLRHTHAAELIAEGVPMNALQKMKFHCNPLY